MTPNSVTWEKGDEAKNSGPTRFRGYGLAVICVAVAFIVRWALDSVWKDSVPFVTFFLAVFVVTQFAGIGPSIFAIVTGFLLGDWFFIPPRHSLLIEGRLYQLN